ncbi:MAG: phosphoglucosamine mutase, partial [Fidelibacterota bacterium]
MLIESISGIRGIFPSDFAASVASRYSLAFHRACEDGDIVIGRDTRPSGGEVVSAVIETLGSVGRGVRDCGVCPTPTVQFAVGDTDAA